MARVRRRRRPVHHKRFPYSKVTVAIVGVCVLLANIASYHLAYLGLDTNASVTEGINTVYGAVLVTYLIKSLGEHWSMNQFGIEEDDE